MGTQLMDCRLLLIPVRRKGIDLVRAVVAAPDGRILFDATRWSAEGARTAALAWAAAGRKPRAIRH